MRSAVIFVALFVVQEDFYFPLIQSPEFHEPERRTDLCRFLQDRI